MLELKALAFRPELSKAREALVPNLQHAKPRA
jgi:hypothetical protein